MKGNNNNCFQNKTTNKIYNIPVKYAFKYFMTYSGPTYLKYLSLSNKIKVMSKIMFIIVNLLKKLKGN